MFSNLSAKKDKVRNSDNGLILINIINYCPLWWKMTVFR